MRTLTVNGLKQVLKRKDIQEYHASVIQSALDLLSRNGESTTFSEKHWALIQRTLEMYPPRKKSR